MSTTLTVSADAAATRSARAVVRDLCATAAVEAETVEVAVLLVTELVTNAVEHGGGAAVVDAEIRDRRLRVSVLDDDPALPTARRPDVGAERGRGLLLVEALAARWSAEVRDGGKSVWFELDLPPLASA